MVRKAIAYAALAVSIAAGTVGAQARTISLGLSGGASLPMAELGKQAKTGYNFGVHVFYHPAMFTDLEFRGDFSYDKWGIQDDEDLSVKATGFSANALYNLPLSTPIRPYVIGGFGNYSKKSVSSSNSVNISGSERNWGVQGGAGVSFDMSGFAAFVETKYVDLFTGASKSFSWVPVTVGIRF